MPEPFIGEIQLFPFNFVPKNWAMCAGQLLPISQNTALFSLLGTNYGGNGTSNFALPNLVGRVAISQGQGPGLPDYVMGEELGQESVALLTSEIPLHTHGLQLASATVGLTPGPTGGSNVFVNPGNNGFVPPPTTTTLSGNAVAPAGGGLPHSNIQPTLAMVYCIALQGVFPQRP